MSQLRLRVMTPSSTVLDVRDVAWVRLRLADGGGIGIWPDHGPLLAESVSGRVVFADDAGEHSREVGSGILSIRDNEVTILTADATAAAKAPRDAGEGGDAMRFRRLARALYQGLGIDRSPSGAGQSGPEQE